MKNLNFLTIFKNGFGNVKTISCAFKFSFAKKIFSFSLATLKKSSYLEVIKFKKLLIALAGFLLLFSANSFGQITTPSIPNFNYTNITLSAPIGYAYDFGYA